MGVAAEAVDGGGEAGETVAVARSPMVTPVRW